MELAARNLDTTTGKGPNLGNLLDYQYRQCGKSMHHNDGYGVSGGPLTPR
jgi:hypothetical protein